MRILLFILILSISARAQKLPITGLKLSEVVAVTGGSSLSAAFTNSTDSYFDVTYKGSKDRLGNFRNYGPPSCSELATISTVSMTGATYTTATAEVNLSSHGTGCTVTVMGMVYATHTNPTTADLYTVTPTVATGPYSFSITGLTEGATYYYRAFAINSFGTAYGAEYSETQPSCTRPGGLTQYIIKTSITRGGVPQGFTASFTDACTALFDYINFGYTINGTDVEAANLNLNTDVYNGWNQTNCNKKSDGYYLFEINSKSGYVYHISGGQIISKDVCPQ